MWDGGLSTSGYIDLSGALLLTRFSHSNDPVASAHPLLSYPSSGYITATPRAASYTAMAAAMASTTTTKTTGDTAPTADVDTYPMGSNADSSEKTSGWRGIVEKLRRGKEFLSSFCASVSVSLTEHRASGRWFADA